MLYLYQRRQSVKIFESLIQNNVQTTMFFFLNLHWIYWTKFLFSIQHATSRLDDAKIKRVKTFKLTGLMVDERVGMEKS